MPRARRRASDRLLRGEPLRQPGRDAGGSDVRLSSAGLLMSGRLVRVFLAGMALAALIAVILATWALASVRADTPQTYDDIAAHYKYGSIGSEPGVSLLNPIGGVLPPYWVFRNLPNICPDKLPGGYASLGFVYEP